MKMNAASRFSENCGTATPGRGMRAGSTCAPCGRPDRERVAHGLTFLVANASSPSAPSSVGFGASGSRVWTVATTERPGRSGDFLQHLLGERDAHGDTLHDLGEIAGRVVRRQQRELRARGRRNRRHHALDDPPVERVDGDVDLLPGPDVGELGLLEVGVDVRIVQRHERHQPGSRLHELPDLGRLVADDPVEGSDHAREREIAFRHDQSRNEFVALARSLVFLGLEHIEIGLGAFQRRGRRGLARLGGGKRGGGAIAVGGRLLEALLRAEIRLRKFVGAVVFQRGALDVGLRALLLRRRGGDLRLGLGDDRALGVDLPGEAGDGRVLGADARSGRVDRVLIVAVVDRGEQVALVDDLIVDDRNRGQMTHRLGGDDRSVGADVGVVGRDEEPPLDEPVVGRLAAIAERGEDQHRHDESAQAGALGRRGLGDRRASGRRVHGNARARPGGRGGNAWRRGHRPRKSRSARRRDIGVVGHLKNPP